MFTQKYLLEFVLHARNVSLEAVKNSFAEFGENLEIASQKEEMDNGSNFKISIQTHDPTIIFDICSGFGRIKEIKVQEI